MHAHTHTHSQLYSASADKSGSIWDIETGRRIKRIKEHTSIVNSIACNRKYVRWRVWCTRWGRRH